jgi:hypothetical protein
MTAISSRVARANLPVSRPTFDAALLKRASAPLIAGKAQALSAMSLYGTRGANWRSPIEASRSFGCSFMSERRTHAAFDPVSAPLLHQPPPPAVRCSRPLSFIRSLLHTTDLITPTTFLNTLLFALSSYVRVTPSALAVRSALLIAITTTS